MILAVLAMVIKDNDKDKDLLEELAIFSMNNVFHFKPTKHSLLFLFAY